MKAFCCKKSSRSIRVISSVSWSLGLRESLPTSWTISLSSFSSCSRCMAWSRFCMNACPRCSSNHGRRESRYRE